MRRFIVNSWITETRNEATVVENFLRIGVRFDPGATGENAKRSHRCGAVSGDANIYLSAEGV
ncbi:MAG: hypothetical protein ACREQR_04655 [Candidatus Binataceae bacterium]